jgi:hypothetical protein
MYDVRAKMCILNESTAQDITLEHPLERSFATKLAWGMTSSEEPRRLDNIIC